MSYVKKLKCLLCGKEYTSKEVKYNCPQCGDEGILEVIYDYSGIKKDFNPVILEKNKEFSMWRYLPLLPIDDPTKIGPLKVGWTPLYEAKRIREDLGMPNFWIKDDGRNPTASLKDRPSALAVVKAQELGEEIVTCASTGNAASSLAGAAASVGLKSYIFVPQTAPAAKIAQLLVFGATVFAVRGSYDKAFDLSIEATREFGWYNRNTAFNPYMVEGKKTVALEIIEQMNFDVPDYLFVPVGDGCIISGVAKAYKEVFSLGFITHLPKLVAVQAEGCKPIVDAVNGDGKVKFVEPNTIADSIAVGIPRNRLMAVRDVKESKGFGVAVSDKEILEAIRYLGVKQGIFAEPAGAAAFAGMLKALKEGIISKKDKVVVLITGNGLKDVESAKKAGGEALVIDPCLEAVKEVIKKHIKEDEQL
ncbi:MAG TPA: threonine synthase [Candidatus Atribacteria bacterium]|uniref:Threonine synthase n=1 Tax=candidate division TA06 bacterium 34_109 TaxID=1635277 RepID=A0A101I0S2_UNCT6|nr:MAG: Threonine synthase [candidate division TA06 bacterium 34_109]HBY57668.1 threonine synthase [Candidatus Atribacteria bacterium]